MLKIRLSHAYILIALVLGLVAAFYIGSHSKKLTLDAEAQENTQKQDDQSKIVKLDDTVLKEFDIQTDIAGPGRIQVHKILPAEIAFNSDKLAHIAPRVPGVVCEVRKNVGENVKAGDVLAVIESRELADIKAGYLGACEKLSLSEASFKREETLWQKKITAEQEYLDAKRTLADASIELRASEQKLHALGFSEQYLKELPNLPDASFVRYEISSPIDGTIVEKHIVLGEVLKEDSSPFIVADLSAVWCNLNVHQKDLPYIRTGQPVMITAGKLQSQGVIMYISSTVHEETRTVVARIEISNADGRWRPGLFATASVVIDDVNVPVCVPKESVIMLDAKDCIFIETDKGFESQAVTLGRANDINVEIVSGLNPGQTYVTKGAFTLKSELNKPTEEE
jgi:cobalt-zinc-cadmium efflux system membrane fusion protein